jgi:hypothetical protein
MLTENLLWYPPSEVAPPSGVQLLLWVRTDAHGPGWRAAVWEAGRWLTTDEQAPLTGVEVLYWAQPQGPLPWYRRQRG